MKYHSNLSRILSLTFASLCGFIFFQQASAIVDGKKSKVRSVVSFIYHHPGYKKEFNCSGVLISNRHILTAEHCAEKEQVHLANSMVNSEVDINNFKYFEPGPEFYSVYFGDGVLISSKDSESEYKKIQNLKGLKVIAVDQIDQSIEGASDMAILTLAEPIRNIEPALLPDFDISLDPAAYVQGNYKFLAVGFGGQTSDNPNLQKNNETIFRGIKLEIMPLFLKRNSPYSLNTNGKEFEVTFSGNQGTAQGDSGGPLFIVANGKLMVVGIVRGIPYTSVSKNIKWIKSILNRKI